LVGYSYQGPPPGGELHRWDAATGQLLARVVPEGFDGDDPRDAYHEWLLSSGGRHLAIRQGRTVHLFDTRTGKRLVLPAHRTAIPAWSFIPDETSLAVASEDQNVRLWDPTTGKLQRRLDLGKRTTKLSWLCFTPDGRGLATGESWRKVHLWEFPTGEHRM